MEGGREGGGEREGDNGWMEEGEERERGREDGWREGVG